MARKMKRGQMAIWIILAIVLVGTMILFFTVERKVNTTQPEILSPELQVRQCTKEAVNSVLAQTLPHGGFVEPRNTKLYKGINISYLCDNIGFYKPCINQHPLLIKEMNAEIKEKITPELQTCFSIIDGDYASRNAELETGPLSFDVRLAPGRVYVDINRSMTITQRGSSRTFSSYQVEIPSPAYDLGSIASEIASQEAKYCYFEYVGYMLLYPSFRISKTALPDSTKIYTITDKKSGDAMNIAIRSCAIPQGI
ncbi:hypothetical protein KW805_04815 [Candidatus Pacearchaeota archaeon]|nr:hypothetical protein [Candidatus Pacearchaeota archaeon]